MSTSSADTHPHLDHSAFLGARFQHRIDIGERFFSRHAEPIAACASAMADRFFAGGKLLVIGTGFAASDAQHNAVEYVHPVLPGCRALPALSLTSDLGVVTGFMGRPDPEAVFEHQVTVLAAPQDILLAFADVPIGAAIRRGLRTGEARDLLSVALLAGPGEVEQVAQHQFHVDEPDPMLAQEVHLASYHILWELVHLVLNHRGIARSGPRGET